MNSYRIGGIFWAILISLILGILRLFNVIDWAWYYILAPIFVMLGLFLFLCLIIGILYVIRELA